MPTEQEYINYKDFVESLDEATPSANDKAVFNDANGPKGSLYSAIANFVLNLWAAFVNAFTAKTSFVSGDKITVVNGPTATAMEVYKLLELTAQNALEDNVAPDFVPNETNAVAGMPYVYGGKVYVAKEDYSGEWDASKFKLASVYDIIKVLPQSDTNKLPLEDGFYITNGAKVSAKQESSGYKCVKYYGDVGDTFFIVGAGASYGRLWATFDIDDNIIRVADSSAAKNWNDNFTVTLEPGEVGIVYNASYTSLTDLEILGIRLINLCVGHETQTKRLNVVEKSYDELKNDVNGEIENKVYEFRANSGSRVSFYYAVEAPAKFYLKKNSASITSYKIFWYDSTGVNPNTQWKRGVQFDEVVELDAYPSGYDQLIFYSSDTSSTAISLDLYEYNLQNVDYRIEEATKDIKEIVETPSQSTAYHFTDSLGSRLRFYYKPSELPFKFYLKKNTYDFDDYEIYWSDSNGVNALTRWKTGVPFGDNITVTEFPEGYDQLYFFRTGYTETYAIDVELVKYNLNSFNYKLEEVDGKIENPYKGLKIVCFGDSITQFNYNGKGYPDYLGEMSDATIVNGAIGGTRYSMRGEPTATPDSVLKAWRPLDISYLVHAWCTNDWTIVDANVQYLHDHDNRNYAPIITALKNNPISTADVVTIMAGTNDFSSEASLGTSGSTDKSTVFGAINSIIQEILTTNPKIKLFMFSPTVRWYDYSGVATSDPEKFSDVIVRAGLTLKEFSAAVVGEIEKSHIPVCDMYNTLGWNKWNFSNYFLDTDGTHPYKGFQNLANRFYAFLKSFGN